MPPPVHVPELLDRIRRSGIVPAERLEGFLVGLQSAGIAPSAPGDMLERLIEAGLITRFHADKLAAGKYKGFQLGSYLILDQIGTGGMGQVYLAEHARMRRLVALKVLPVFSSDDVVARERFFREARAAGTLDHPNIVRVFDLCQEGKLLYLVMEYVEGVSLQAVVGRFGPLSVEAACHYARQVAFGLQHAHELGFVHRDIKPANLLLDQLGVVKILDLGLVRSEADREAGLTKQLDNKILGTADYVAPEQAVNSSDVDIRADIYSLGATFYFFLTGRTLFPEGRTAQKLVWQQIKDPVPVERLRPEVSQELAAVINRMLRKAAGERYSTPAEVFEALAPFVPDEVPLPEPAWLPEPSARVAQARAVMPSAGAPSVSGSSSQILAAALGGARANAGARRSSRIAINSAHDSSQLSLSGRGVGLEGAYEPTRAVSIDDTQSNPEPETALEPMRDRGLKILIAVLAVALVLAIIAILVMVAA
jgi:serine/threonine-protein kinase